jgi:hypothetical protein
LCRSDPQLAAIITLLRPLRNRSDLGNGCSRLLAYAIIIMGWLHLKGEVLQAMDQIITVGGVANITAQEMLSFLHAVTGLEALRPRFQQRWTRYYSLVQRLKRVHDRLCAREEYLSAEESALQRALVFVLGYDVLPMRNAADCPVFPLKTYDILYVQSMSSVMETFANLM